MHAIDALKMSQKMYLHWNFINNRIVLSNKWYEYVDFALHYKKRTNYRSFFSGWR